MNLRRLKMINNTDIRNNQKRLIAQTGSDDKQFPLKLFHFDEFNYGARYISWLLSSGFSKSTDFRNYVKQCKSCYVIYPTVSSWMYSVINSLIFLTLQIVIIHYYVSVTLFMG